MSRRLRADIVVNNLVAHAVTSGKVLLQSDGTPWRPLVHIRDIIAGVRAGLTAPRHAIHNQAFNIGRSGENYRIRDVANMVAEVVPNCVVTFAKDASPDIRNYRVDFGKAERGLPGFTPEWTLRKGIEELYHGYLQAGLTTADFNGPRYFRLRTVQSLLDRQAVDAMLRWTH
jgi:nucleoside-diphosphate-sugar epimerase